MRRRPPTVQPLRCKCIHVADAPQWHGKRRSGGGLTTRSATGHGNVFAHTGACVHDELNRVTKPRRRRQGVSRLRLG